MCSFIHHDISVQKRMGESLPTEEGSCVCTTSLFLTVRVEEFSLKNTEVDPKSYKRDQEMADVLTIYSSTIMVSQVPFIAQITLVE